MDWTSQHCLHPNHSSLQKLTLTCLAQMMEPETGGMSLTVLMRNAELLAYWLCGSHGQVFVQ